ncbi:MAG: ComEC/Rec2 family competence protein, partial [Clostridia bacterium]
MAFRACPQEGYGILSQVVGLLGAIMSPPLLALAVSAGVGIVTGMFLGPAVHISASLVGLTALALLLTSRSYRYGRLAWLLLVIGVAGLGMLRAQVALGDVVVVRDELTNLDVEVVPSRPGVSEARWYGEVRDGGSIRDLEGAKVVVESPGAPMSSRYELRGTLRPPPAPRNPGSFDYGAYLRSRGISGIFEADTMNAIGEERAATNILARVTEGLECRGIGTGGAALARALSLGDRRGLTEGDEEALRRLGLAHLLAVSGIHVAMVGYVFRRGMNVLFGRVTAGLMAACAVGYYAFLVGATPSVLRAAMVFGIYTLSEVFDSKMPPSHALVWAALVLLIRDPFDALDVGFQLSFAAAMAILFAHRSISRRRGRFLTLTACSAAAWFATAPILLHHFDRIAPLGLILSPLVLPAFPVILAAAWSAALASLVGLSPELLAVLVTPLTWIMEISRTAGEWAPTIQARTSAVAPAFLAASVLVVLMKDR